MRRTAVILALAALLAAPISARGADAWEREFQANISSLDSNVQYLAVTKLDPAIPKARDYLYSVLGTGSWHLREGAVQTLAAAPSEALEDMRKEMRTHKIAQAREGIVLAFGRRKSDEFVPDYIAALADKHPDVRRAAVFAILDKPTKEAITGIIDAWKKEKEFTCAVYYKSALETLTKNFFGWQVSDWEGWWLAKQDKWKAPKPPKKPGEPKTPEEEAEEKADAEASEGKEKPAEETTTLRDVEITIKESGKGGPLFVLPDLYRNKLYFENHFQALEDVSRLFYIDLPPLSKFRGLKNLGVSGKPYYPVDMVADAFDELRKERKQEKIAILGHGMAAWVGMRYASKYPNNVSHLILVSTWSSNAKWSEGRARVENWGRGQKQPEVEHYAKNIVQNPDTGKHEYEPKDPQEEEAMSRAGWTTWFADPRLTFAQMWFRPSHVDMGGCWVPEFNIAKEKPNKVPTLILHGAHPRSQWCSAGDMKALAQCYPSSTIIPFPNSADLPWIEDHDMFVKTIKGWFKKNPFPKKK